MKYDQVSRNNKLWNLIWLCFSEQGIVKGIVKKLGKFHLLNKVSESTTHVVSGSNRRTLNILYGIARGCWIVSQEWVSNTVLVNMYSMQGSKHQGKSGSFFFWKVREFCLGSGKGKGFCSAVNLVSALIFSSSQMFASLHSAFLSPPVLMQDGGS